MNSANFFWKNPAEKSFDDSLLLYNATLSIDGIQDFQKFDRVQIRMPNIILFYDEYINLGSDEEKKRADTLKKKTNEGKKTIHLISKVRFNSFFDITGIFYGLFKSKSTQKYIPLTNAVMYEIIRQQDKWVKKKIQLANNFVGVNTSYIESCTFD